MTPNTTHPATADVAFDGGDLDCGNGLLLLIRKHIDPLPRGGLLEIRSTEISVDEDLPAWCRLTGNELVSFTKTGQQRSFLVCKGTLAERGGAAAPAPKLAAQPRQPVAAAAPQASALPRREPVAPRPVPALAVTGMGSWPRPRWMVQALHDHVQGRLEDAAFHETADDAVRLIVAAQQRAGAHVFTDGEQRRDSYSSFVATRLENCQLVPLIDLLPLVEDPAAFEAELRALDVPANEVRHPGVFGRIRRSRPIAVHELDFMHRASSAPVKVALPGPYLLTRTMWMDCIADNVYATREQIAADIVQVLREEVQDLLDAGASIVQLDEPVLSEVVFSGAKNQRSFMCGALSESFGPEHELAFAKELVNAVVRGLPRERIALHVCRGNWTPDETVALAGSYAPLLPTLARMQVGNFLLEACTPRAGDMALLKALPEDARIGVGVVNQKTPHIEPVDEVAARIERAIGLFGRDRVLLHPDCGFATFADNPICSQQIAEGKLAAIVQAAERFRV
ncbi:MAG: 5-methyltetrahydropteroyltriglutamate--homocysteine methyltransferase [Rubrivivax sp.]